MFAYKNFSKFKIDVLWNMLAFGGIVLIGVLLNIIIVRFYDEEALGVFNQAYAIYIFLSQLAVGGVHLSIQYFTPVYMKSEKHSGDLLISAIYVSLLNSFIVVGISYLMIPLFGKILNSENVEKSLYYILWGLIFFSINKIILSFHNGLRNMKTFAFFQFLRFFLMLLVLVYFIWFHYSIIYLPSVLSFSEFFLFLFLLMSAGKYLLIRFSRRLKKIFLIQFIHGYKVLLGNFLLDLNTKVDVLLLGIFLEDKAIGIYSFAATIFEGFSQIAVLLRNNFNPIITKLYNKKNTLVFQKIMRKNIRSFFKIIFLLGLVSMIVFPLVPFIFGISNIIQMTAVYFILCVGFMVNGGYNALLMIFNQIGLPKLQSDFILTVFLSNVVFNLMFIPIFGIYGSALGTALSYIVQMIVLKYIFKKKLNIEI